MFLRLLKDLPLMNRIVIEQGEWRNFRPLIGGLPRRLPSCSLFKISSR